MFAKDVGCGIPQAAAYGLDAASFISGYAELGERLCDSSIQLGYGVGGYCKAVMELLKGS